MARIIGNGLIQARTAAGGLLIHDTFTDADGTLLVNHVISPVNVPGAAWLEFAIAFDRSGVILGNKATIALNFGPVAIRGCYVVSGVADCQVDVDVTANIAGAAGTGLICRYNSSNSTYWMLDILPGPSNLIRMVESGAVIRASASVSIAVGEVVPVSAILSGNVITFTVKGVSINYTSTLNNTSTKHGVGILASGTARTYADNFKITPL
jgi:hypothetical protein